MAQPPPTALLRLRAADVVRLCGLAAAARGLELATRRAVSSGRRNGARLDALVADGTPGNSGTPLGAWAALAGEGAIASLRWGCACQGVNGTVNGTVNGDAPAGERGCAHVAAVLTAWIRHPEDFTPQPDATASAAAEQPQPVAVTGPASVAASVGASQLPARAAHGARAVSVRQPVLLAPPRTRRPAGDLTLTGELARLATADVTAMARRVLGVEASAGEARTLLAAALGDGEHLRALLERLDERTQRLLTALALSGGAVTETDLEGMGTRTSVALSALHAALTVLERHGLVFRVAELDTTAPQAEHPAHHSAGWRIAPEIRAALPLHMLLAPLTPLETTGDRAPLLAPANEVPSPSEVAPRRRPARIERASPRPLAQALALLALAPQPAGVRDAPPASTQPSRIAHDARRPQTESRAESGVAGLAPGELAPERLREVARAAGLQQEVVRLARRVLLLARDAGGRHPVLELAATPSEERLRVLRSAFHLWSTSETAADLIDLDASGSALRVRVDLAHDAFQPSAVAADVYAARSFVLGLLARVQPAVWYPLDALLDLIWQVRPLFLRAGQQTYERPAWWLEDRAAHRPLRPLVRAEWQAGDAQFVRHLLAGPLYAWGAVDLARDDAGACRAFRLTPTGAYLLSRTSPAAPDERLRQSLGGDWGPPALPTRDGALAVQPLAAGAALLDALGTWARPDHVAGGRLIYSLRADLAAAAFDRGASSDDMLAQLRSADAQGGARAAERIAPQLSAWRTAYGRARIETGWALLEARDEPTLAEALARLPEVAPRCRRLGPALALVPNDDVDAVREALARAGYHL